jgi:hypothetical protein
MALVRSTTVWCSALSVLPQQAELDIKLDARITAAASWVEYYLQAHLYPEMFEDSVRFVTNTIELCNSLRSLLPPWLTDSMPSFELPSMQSDEQLTEALQASHAALSEVQASLQATKLGGRGQPVLEKLEALDTWLQAVHTFIPMMLEAAAYVRACHEEVRLSSWQGDPCTENPSHICMRRACLHWGHLPL